MSVRISNCAGSKEFRRPLIRAGVPVVMRTIKEMPFGDFSFFGNGPHGRVRIGIERKTVAEIAGEMTAKRLKGHQLPGMTRHFQYRFLIIEGEIYIDENGFLNPMSLAHLPRGVLYASVQKFELTMALKGAIRIVHTKNKDHTTQCIKVLYDWFQERWSKHTSAFEVAEDAPERALLDQRTMKRKIANQLAGVSWQRSLKADAYFPSIVSMIVGDPLFHHSDMYDETIWRGEARAHWQKALGVKKGTKTAKRIVDTCYSRDDVTGKGN